MDITKLLSRYPEIKTFDLVEKTEEELETDPSGSWSLFHFYLNGEKLGDSLSGWVVIISESNKNLKERSKFKDDNSAKECLIEVFTPGDERFLMSCEIKKHRLIGFLVEFSKFDFFD